MKILGIGNAIVDVICKVDDSFISENGLTKSTMKLIFDEPRLTRLRKNSFEYSNLLKIVDAFSPSTLSIWK